MIFPHKLDKSVRIVICIEHPGSKGWRKDIAVKERRRLSVDVDGQGNMDLIILII
jgi:hypothetical protein